MQQSRIFFVIAVLVIINTSCIKQYNPEIGGNDAKKYVVTGEVIKGNTIQNINVSQTASISEPTYKYYVPVSGCYVVIVDDKGNVYSAGDMGDGNYQANIPQSMISIGSAFKVEVNIPILGEVSENNRINIVSDYDTIQECPDVDSLYYQLENLPSVNPYNVIKGIRFYCDLNATAYKCRNFRFEEIETWKYKADLATENTYRYCWLTRKINTIFTLSTKNLTQNKFKMVPFHFVDNYSSQRLRFGYSLLVKQYSISDAAFAYWKKIRTNSEDQGGMYEKQPLQIKGNMHNLTKPNIAVLGFFSVSDMTAKRLFVGKIEGLPTEFVPCELPVPTGGPAPPPNPECFNCLLEGGTNIRPDFWPY